MLALCWAWGAAHRQKHHRSILDKVSASSTTALQAFELVMRVLRAWDSTNPSAVYQSWALDARSAWHALSSVLTFRASSAQL
jgi:hypothetical protein